jgi:hypothetical protein
MKQNVDLARTRMLVGQEEGHVPFALEQLDSARCVEKRQRPAEEMVGPIFDRRPWGFTKAA